MPKTVESVFNDNLGSVLRRKHPRWPDLIGVEQTNVLTDGSPALRPDIIVRHPGGLPVAVETEYTPARTVEQDARQRLGKIRETGDTIEQAIAVRIPARLASVNQSDLEAEIEKARLEFCVLSVNPESGKS